MVREFNDQDRNRKKTRIRLPDESRQSPSRDFGTVGSCRNRLGSGRAICPARWPGGSPKTSMSPGLPSGRSWTSGVCGSRIARSGFSGWTRPPTRVMPPSNHLRNWPPDCGNWTPPVVWPVRRFFELARHIKTMPLKVAEAANILALKIRSCQLGCF